MIIDKFKALSVDIYFILTMMFIFAIGSTMALTFFAIYLKNFSVPFSWVGIALGFFTFVLFGGGIIGGFFADRVDAKTGAIIGVSIRILGVIIALFLQSFVYALLSGFLIALGGAFFQPAARSLLLSQISSKQKAFVISLQSSLNNGAMAIGPAIAGFFMVYGFDLMFQISFVLCFISLIILIFLKPTLKKENPSLNFQISSNIKNYFYLIIFPAFFMWGWMHYQLFFIIYIEKIYSAQIYGFLFSLNAFLVMLLQPLLSSWIDKNHSKKVLMIGGLLITLAMFCFSGGKIWIIVLGIFLLSIGEVLATLRLDLDILKIFQNQAGIAYGMKRFSFGIGSVLAGITGSFVIENYFNLYWIGVAFMFIFFSIIIFFFYKKFLI